MKTIFKIVLVVTVFCFSSFVTAQTYDNADATSIAGFDNQAAQENFLTSQNETGTVATNSNSVFISQIGDSNNILSVTESVDSKVTLIQNGNDNLTVLDLDANTLQQTVIQKGDNNSFLDYSPFKTDVRNATINQTGNNQNLTIFGSNSLSEKIKVAMKGQDQSVIIRNF